MLSLIFFLLGVPLQSNFKNPHGLAVESIQLSLLSMFTPLYLPYSPVYCCLTSMLYGT